MPPFVPLRWVDNAWTVLVCPGTEKRLEECEMYLRDNLASMPMPRFVVGEHVSFRWSDGIMSGKIKEIQANNSWNKDSWVIDYSIYANGHGRSVSERNIITGESHAASAT